jgi:hypothetical protein
LGCIKEFEGAVELKNLCSPFVCIKEVCVTGDNCLLRDMVLILSTFSAIF